MTTSTSSISALPIVAAGPDDHLVDVLGQAARDQPLAHQLRGQRGQARRLEDDRVAGGERRDAVAERVRQRVVPRPDHADDAGGRVADDELAAEDERVRGRDLLVGEVLRRVLRPEAEAGGGVGDLGEDRVLVRLAGLGDDRPRDPVGVLGRPLLRPAEDPRPVVEAERLPVALRDAGALDRGGDLGRGLLDDAADHLAGGRVLDLEALRGAAVGLGLGGELSLSHGADPTPLTLLGDGGRDPHRRGQRRGHRGLERARCSRSGWSIGESSPTASTTTAKRRSPSTRPRRGTGSSTSAAGSGRRP